MHQYEPHAYTHQGMAGESVSRSLRWPGGVFEYWRTRTTDTLDASWLRRVVEPVVSFQRRTNGAPIFVGEYGVGDDVPGASEFIRAETALFDSLGWHSAMWGWNCCGRMSMVGTHSDQSNYRGVLQAYLRYWRLNVAVPGESGASAKSP